MKHIANPTGLAVSHISSGQMRVWIIIAWRPLSSSGESKHTSDVGQTVCHQLLASGFSPLATTIALHQPWFVHESKGEHLTNSASTVWLCVALWSCIVARPNCVKVSGEQIYIASRKVGLTTTKEDNVIISS